VRGYKNFIIIFSALLVLYIIAELNKPKPIDWALTISKTDKNPYGGYIVYNELKNIFPGVPVNSYDEPVYNQLNNVEETNTAYVILTPAFEPSQDDYDEMMHYLAQGNYVIISAQTFGRLFLDSLHIKTNRRFAMAQDSASINFVNPLLRSLKPFTFPKFTLDQYFSKLDTTSTTVLGVNEKYQADFIKINYRKGTLLLHSSPVCFSNYFIVTGKNASYTASALSYIPANVSKIYWDENQKLPKEESTTPLAFFLKNEYLRWALRLTMAGLIIYVIFQAKRKQRIIPVMAPLKNSSLDFVKTVSNVYFNQKDNNSIAQKKVSYFLDFVRQRFYLSTTSTDQNFADQLARKSGLGVSQITELVSLLNEVAVSEEVDDHLLFKLDQQIDNFYKQI
jgi:hypothetical protein